MSYYGIIYYGIVDALSKFWSLRGRPPSPLTSAGAPLQVRGDAPLGLVGHGGKLSERAACHPRAREGPGALDGARANTGGSGDIKYALACLGG